MAEEELAVLWRKRLDEIVRSDLTVEKWCEIHGVTTRQYGYWRKRLGYTAVKHRTPPQKWAAVSLIEPAPEPTPPSAALTLRIAGAEIDLRAGFDPVLLRAVVEALGADAC